MGVHTHTYVYVQLVHMVCGICAGSVVYAHMLNMSWICMHVHMHECV